MWKVYDTWCEKGFAIGGVNSIKTNLQTCNLWTGQYVSYKSVNQFWFNLPHKNDKMFVTSMFYLLDKLKPNTQTKTQNNIVIFGIFQKNYIVILAFFETIWLKYDCCLEKLNILIFGFLVF